MHPPADLGPTTLTWVFLVLALGLAFSFEFVNGFHDTANAVATVIYTHTLKPSVAVVWSGLWNLTGVLTSSGAVAFGIISLLPVELVLNVGSGAGFAMVFSLLLSAIIWNVGTWYLGLPASSSHTLIGSIMGVGLANSMLSGHSFGEGVNWAKAKDVGLSLLVSPIVGFIGAALLVLFLKAVVRRPELFREPGKDQPPPPWIRALLVLTCTGVSFSHGSNDGQKGMGLIMLILVGILPGMYALEMKEPPEKIHALVTELHAALPVFQSKAGGAAMGEKDAFSELSGFIHPDGKSSGRTFAALVTITGTLEAELAPIQTFHDLSLDARRTVRKQIYLVGGAISKLAKSKSLGNDAGGQAANKLRGDFVGITQFIPTWVKVAIALALGCGTTVGWKRIVVTVGEKIGKSHLTYGQGASAELVVWATIQAADHLGLPVSTTHVLSSGIAGAMAANRSGLQTATLRNILLAWVLTLPVCMLLGSALFAFGNYLVFHVFGLG